MQNSSIVCVIFDHSLHFSTIAYINLDYSLQFSYGAYSSQPSHANLDTLLSSLACHTLRARILYNVKPKINLPLHLIIYRSKFLL